MKHHLWLLLATIMTVLAVVHLVGCEGDDDDDDNFTDDDTATDDDAVDDDASSDDDSDDDAADDDATDDDAQSDDDVPECEGGANTDPILYSVDLIVNGDVVEQPYVATTDDAISLTFEYYDAECNIEQVPGLGNMYRCEFFVAADDRDRDNLSEEAWDQLVQHEWYLPGIGCSSEESGPYVIELDLATWVVDESEVREYPFIVTLHDGCGFPSQQLFLDFTVNPAE